MALSSEVNPNKNTWIIDSGASRHITGFRDQFKTLEEDFSEEVTIGDNSTYPAKRVGTCSIKLKSGATILLKDVLFVPGIKRNLVSISSLVDQGYRVTFQEDKVLIWTKNTNVKNAISLGYRDGSLYKVGNSIKSALSHEVSNTTEL